MSITSDTMRNESSVRPNNQDSIIKLDNTPKTPNKIVDIVEP